MEQIDSSTPESTLKRMREVLSEALQALGCARERNVGLDDQIAASMRELLTSKGVNWAQRHDVAVGVVLALNMIEVMPVPLDVMNRLVSVLEVLVE